MLFKLLEVLSDDLQERAVNAVLKPLDNSGGIFLLEPTLALFKGL